MSGRKSRRANAQRRDSAAPAPVLHPLIVQANVTPEMAARAPLEVVEVASPYRSEVMDRDGRMILSKAVRRVRRFETLFRSGVFDRSVFTVLDWYAEQLAAADAGLFRCGLDTSGGGGSGNSHIPTSEARMMASGNVRWARGCIPADMIDVFDAVMRDDMSFSAIGAAQYGHMCASRGRERAASMFRLAANWLLLGVGATLRLVTADQAAAVFAAGSGRRGVVA